MQELFNLLKQKGTVLVTAESCTGGMIAKTITDHAGSSSVFERGFVTYTNQAKIEMLDISRTLLKEHGAVSHSVAQAMAIGALNHSHADMAVSCTGIAGPEGGRADKPVGLVYIGIVAQGSSAKAKSFEHHFKGNRNAVRAQTVDAALKHVKDELI